MGIKRNGKNRKSGAAGTRPRKVAKNNSHSPYLGFCHGAEETARRKRQIDAGKLRVE